MVLKEILGTYSVRGHGDVNLWIRWCLIWFVHHNKVDPPDSNCKGRVFYNFVLLLSPITIKISEIETGSSGPLKQARN